MGQVSLHHAVIHSRTSAAEFLLFWGANVNVKDEKGRTSLHYAAISGSPEMVSLLLKRKADPAVQDKEGKVAEDYAISLSHGSRGAMYVRVVTILRLHKLGTGEQGNYRHERGFNLLEFFMEAYK